MTERDPEQRTVAPDGRPESAQPAWRRAFPIDVPQDNYVARRDFTRFLGLTSLAFVVGQVWIGIQSWLRRRQAGPPVAEVATLDQIPVGSMLTFRYPGPDDACLLLRPDAQTLVAYSQQCTHLSCAVVPDTEVGRLRCPCHHGLFDVGTGRPLAGPPRRPLPRIVLEVRGARIYATGVELRAV
jgi:Rieske Fe-S protein